MEGNFVRITSLLVGLVSAIGLLAVGTGHVQPSETPLSVDDRFGFLFLGVACLIIVVGFNWPSRMEG